MLYLYYGVLHGNLNNEVLIHVTWMKLENIVLNETSPS